MIGLTACIVGALAAWGAAALWYRAPGGRPRRLVTAAAWALFSLAILAALAGFHPAFLGPRPAFVGPRPVLAAAVFAAVFAVLLLWWRGLKPSNAGAWADEVAETTSGSVQGQRVLLRNVRNFDWRSPDDYTPRWETRSYDLQHLHSLDMIMSYWTVPAIAHVLISFGFDDGDHVVFSVEIRRERTQQFSAIGGFFKEFELCILAADERDVIRLRTNVRGEDDYLYRVRMPAAAMRSLFLAYVEQANALVRAPRFYNTVTVNCTTLIYHMMNLILGNLPLDYRVLFSGYLPAYIYRVGGLDARYTLGELRAFGRITERARRADRSASFSADIRQGIPS
jgi:hypothetical protein